MDVSYAAVGGLWDAITDLLDTPTAKKYGSHI